MSVTARHPGICDGCGTHTAGGGYCASCMRSAAELEDSFARRHSDPVLPAGARIRSRLWILNLVFVLGGVAYLGLVHGADLLAWLGLLK